MSDAWAIILGAAVAAGSSAGTAFVLRGWEFKRWRRESEVAALKDLAVALTAWYESMLDLARSPTSASSPSTKRYPELRILMLTERVRDAEVRAAIDALVESEGQVVISLDPSADREQRQRLLAPVMRLYPDVQHKIGARIRELE